MFFLFPDPHFKKKKHKSRIITPALLTQYSYFLKENGALYISTDVHDLFVWMCNCLDSHPLFRPFSKEEFENDICTPFLYKGTEESRKAEYRNASIYASAYYRISSLNNPKCEAWKGLYYPDAEEECGELN